MGILLQTNKIPEDPKDGPKDAPILYSVGEMIQIGMNQATNKSHAEMIKSDDYLAEGEGGNTEPSGSDGNARWHDSVVRFTKEFVQNRCIPVYPTDPLYVQRVLKGLQEDVFDLISLGSTNYPNEAEERELAKRFFFLYHIMLRTLRFTNEIVVDISTNSIQTLFWLGAAHGFDTNAISIRREETPAERLTLTGNPEKRERFIFDVAGLWTAVYRSSDTRGFYSQLAKAQAGIERHSKLILQNRSYYSTNLNEAFWNASPAQGQEDTERLRVEKEDQENIALESYLRNQFWKPMLKYNRLRIYLEQIDEIDRFKEPRPNILKWDVDAVACLNNYLSKRTVINEYEVKTLHEREIDSSAEAVNYICVGNVIKIEEAGTPGDKHQDGSLLASINNLPGLSCKVRRRFATRFIPRFNEKDPVDCRKMLKGFDDDDTKTPKWLTQLPMINCMECLKKWSEGCQKNLQNPIINDPDGIPAGSQNDPCHLKCNCSPLEQFSPDDEKEKNRYHTELAQLVLWRESKKLPSDSGSVNADQDRYRVVITGASGPATKALVSVFVDDSLKQYPLPQLKSELDTGEPISDVDLRRFPLVNLQNKIRNELIDRFFAAIDSCKAEYKKTHDDLLKDYTEEDIDHYFARIKQSSRLYLSTVLYKYFFPFVSTEEIQCIFNGMQMYIFSLRATNTSPYAVNYEGVLDEGVRKPLPPDFIKDIAKEIPNILKKTLDSLRGIDALFAVEVKNNVAITNQIVAAQQPGQGAQEETGEPNSHTIHIDTREIIGIRSLDDKDSLRCLFLDDNPDTKDSK